MEINQGLGKRWLIFFVAQVDLVMVDPPIFAARSLKNCFADGLTARQKIMLFFGKA